MIALLILTIIITPTESDLEYMGALLCGETCGMPRAAMEFVAGQLRHDWYSMGTRGLTRRWYAPLKPSRAATRIVREAFENEAVGGERCRLVGNARDVIYWSENGYLPPDAVPDYHWESRGMSVSAFDCVWRRFQVRRWKCEGDACPQ